MQKHERIALAIIVEGAQALGLEATVKPHSGKSHMRVELRDPETGRREVMTITSSPRGGCEVVAGVTRQAPRRTARKILGR